MSEADEPIPVTGLKRGTVQAATELHITDGLRAVMQGRGLWSLRPLLRDRATVALNPLPIDQVRQLLGRIGAEIFGGDEISGLGTSLLSRSWTPLDATHDRQMQPAVTWSLIAGTAHRSGDEVMRRWLATCLIVFMRPASGYVMRPTATTSSLGRRFPRSARPATDSATSRCSISSSPFTPCCPKWRAPATILPRRWL